MKIQRTISYNISEKAVRMYFEDDEEMANYNEEEFEDLLSFVLEGEDFDYEKDFQGDIWQMKDLFNTLKNEAIERLNSEEDKENRRIELINDIEYFTHKLKEAKKRLEELGS